MDELQNYKTTDKLGWANSGEYAIFPRGVRQFYSLGSPPNCSNFPRDTKRMVFMWVYTEEWFVFNKEFVASLRAGIDSWWVV